MNNKKGIIPLTLVFLLVFVTACKKYDEGPLISFRRPQKRVVGTWKVEHFYVDGVDSIQKFNAQLNDTIVIPLYLKPSQANISDFLYIPKKHGILYEYYVYVINIGKTQISINNYLVSTYSDVFTPDPQFLEIGTIFTIATDYGLIFKIKRLTNKELIMETTVSNKVYRIEMKKIIDNGEISKV